jgi:hypothetical protein
VKMPHTRLAIAFPLVGTSRAVNGPGPTTVEF